MSKVQVKILTQLEENYGFHEGTVHWKPKGGLEFTTEVSDGLMMYGDTDIIKKSIQLLLDKESNDLERYTYVSHELVFHKPIVLKGSVDNVYDELYNQVEV